MPVWERMLPVDGLHSMIIECLCGYSDEHQVRFSYFDASEEDEMFVSFHLSPYYGFFARLWKAIKYVAGYSSKYGHWDEVVLSSVEAKELCAFLEDYYTRVAIANRRVK